MLVVGLKDQEASDEIPLKQTDAVVAAQEQPTWGCSVVPHIDVDVLGHVAAEAESAGADAEIDCDVGHGEAFQAKKCSLLHLRSEVASV